MTDHRVLVVDDEDNVRGLLEQILRRDGYTTLAVKSAEEALTALEKAPYPVVLADISLPGMSGLDLIGHIKRRYDSDVIVITGRVEEYTYGEAISQGASDFIVKPVRSDELLLRLKRVLEEREMKRTQARIMRELQNLVITDSLTGLSNSRHFHTQIEIERERARRYHHALTLLIIDVDHFKKINDAYGHLEGDRVLAALASLVQSLIRRTDSAYRYGGEEFTVLLPETEGTEAQRVADRIRLEIAGAAFFKTPENQTPVTVSIGVAQWQADESTASFIKRADAALYQAKASGRNSVCVQSAS